jgi:hypothetical protein
LGKAATQARTTLIAALLLAQTVLFESLVPYPRTASVAYLGVVSLGLGAWGVALATGRRQWDSGEIFVACMAAFVLTIGVFPARALAARSA